MPLTQIISQELREEIRGFYEKERKRHLNMLVGLYSDNETFFFERGTRLTEVPKVISDPELIILESPAKTGELPRILSYLAHYKEPYHPLSAPNAYLIGNQFQLVVGVNIDIHNPNLHLSSLEQSKILKYVFHPYIFLRITNETDLKAAEEVLPKQLNYWFEEKPPLHVTIAGNLQKKQQKRKKVNRKEKTAKKKSKSFSIMFHS